MKKFKAESQKLLDLMINSVYTNKEIFLRELISNASDALDKRYYRSLSEENVSLGGEELAIRITSDSAARTLTISDNGCGMDEPELEKDLGTIASSGSLDFKQANQNENIDIIGQFGVGFYSAFMVADRVTVISRITSPLTAIRLGNGRAAALRAIPSARRKKKAWAPMSFCSCGRIRKTSAFPNIWKNGG